MIPANKGSQDVGGLVNMVTCRLVTPSSHRVGLFTANSHCFTSNSTKYSGTTAWFTRLSLWVNGWLHLLCGYSYLEMIGACLLKIVFA